MDPLFQAAGRWSRQHRIHALKALDKIQQGQFVPYLDGRVRKGEPFSPIAANWLNDLGIPGQVDKIVAFLKHPNPEVRRMAAKQLADFSEKRVRDALYETARSDRDQMVKSEALGALDRLGDKRARELMGG